MAKLGIELEVSVKRKDKHPLEELVTKRVSLTQKEYSDIMFYLEIMVDLYQRMKEDNPQYDDCSEEYPDELREVDFRDMGRADGWGRSLIDTFKKVTRKAHAGKNIVGDSKHYPFVTYSKEEGLREKGFDGTIYEADPYELML